MKKAKFGLNSLLLMFAVLPLLIAGVVLTAVGVSNLSKELDTATFERLRACATSVKTWYEYDIINDNLDLEDFEFIDSLEAQEIELTLFQQDTRAVTSIKNADGSRNIGTKCDPAVWATVSSGKDYTSDSVTINGSNYYVYYMPIYDADGQIYGMAFAGEKSAFIEEALSKVVTLSILIALIIIVICTGIAIFVAKIVSTPISVVANAMNQVADGDLSGEIKARTNVKESVLLLEAATKLQGELRNIIGKTKNISIDLKSGAQSVSQLAEQSSDGANQISSAIDDLAQGATSMAQNVQAINEQVITIGASIDNIADNVDTLDKASTESENANKVASEYMDKLHEASNRSADGVEEISGLISACETSANKIKDAVEMISTIASQTNLLALNASIEAARAGEAGKGFAVVATEIKSLSEQSNASAEDIKSMVNEIFDNVNACVDGSRRLTDIISNQMKYLNETTEKIEDMSSTGKAMAESAHAIGAETKVLVEAKNEVMSNVTDLSAISEENAASNEQVAASVSGIVDAISEIAENSNTTNSSATDLTDTVSYFN